VVALIVLPVTLTGCAEPPDKEINQAQGAIAAARAAGAETFASNEYKAAAEALDKARQAVSQRDYRLALNHALDARERAETAARTAADEKARARAAAEAAWQSAQQALQASKGALDAARDARVTERRLTPFNRAIDQVEHALLSLRSRIDQGDLIAPTEELAAAKAKLDQVRSEIDAAATARSAQKSPASKRR